jgi:Do/DeqQ family serine protease
MKFINKNILIAALAIIILALGINHFSCSKNKTSSLFGNSGKTPIKDEIEATKAFEIQTVFRKIFNMNKDSVVFITTEQFVRIRNPFFDDGVIREFFGHKGGSNIQKRTGLGTGFILSEDGYICTNHHVISGVDKIIVNINDKNYEAKIIGSDERTDIGLLKIEPESKLTPVYFGDSDKVEVGDWAIAIGNPFGLDKTFTVGVISATGRRDVDHMGGSHIQTDASINPGNSGGPLINIYGEVIGINRMIYSQSGGYMGIGFAIPINTAKSILGQLQKNKKVIRGYLGVNLIAISDTDAKKLGLDQNQGIFVREIISGSPAESGGIRVGDVIMQINDKNIKEIKDLFQVLEEIPVGDSATVTLWRNKELKRLYIKIKERP